MLGSRGDQFGFQLKPQTIRVWQIVDWNMVERDIQRALLDWPSNRKDWRCYPLPIEFGEFPRTKCLCEGREPLKKITQPRIHGEPIIDPLGMCNPHSVNNFTKRLACRKTRCFDKALYLPVLRSFPLGNWG
jgi:hypothetical protein